MWGGEVSAPSDAAAAQRRQGAEAKTARFAQRSARRSW